MHLLSETMKIGTQENLPILWDYASYSLGIFAIAIEIKPRDISEIMDQFTQDLQVPQSTNLWTLFAILFLSDSKEIVNRIPNLFKLVIELPLWEESENIYTQHPPEFQLELKQIWLEILLTHFSQNEEDLEEIRNNEYWDQIKELIQDPSLTEIVSNLVEIVENPEFSEGEECSNL